MEETFKEKDLTEDECRTIWKICRKQTTTIDDNEYFDYACKLCEVAQVFWNLNLVAHQFDVEYSFINVVLKSAALSRRDFRCSQRPD